MGINPRIPAHGTMCTAGKEAHVRGVISEMGQSTGCQQDAGPRCPPVSPLFTVKPHHKMPLGLAVTVKAAVAADFHSPGNCVQDRVASTERPNPPLVSLQKEEGAPERG